VRFSIEEIIQVGREWISNSNK